MAALVGDLKRLLRSPFTTRSKVFLGLMAMNTGFSMGFALALRQRPGLGLLLILLGSIAGAALTWLEMQRPTPVPQPVAPPAPPASAATPAPSAAKTGAHAATQRPPSADALTQRPPAGARPGPAAGPSATVTQYTQPQDVAKAEHTPGGGGREFQSEATVAEVTIAKDFQPDYTARAVRGLAEVYAELSKPGVHGYLLVIAGPDRDTGCPVEEIPITIGRAAFNKFTLRDQSISTEQATILYQNGHVYLTDNQSKNGTFLNNERITSQKLENCDVIAFGDTKILITLA